MSDAAFDWDEHNEPKVRRHRVSPAEAEHAVINGEVLDIYTVEGEERVLYVGHTGAGRVIHVSTVERVEGLIRVVTAYDASPRTVRNYWLNRVQGRTT